MELKEKIEMLGQLRALRLETRDLHRRLEAKELWEAARAPGQEPRLAALSARLEKRLCRSLDLLDALNAFIDGIDDSRMRLIMTYRYVDGDTWRRVAARIGEWDEQYPRRLHDEYLRRAGLEAYMTGTEGGDRRDEA